MTWPRISLSPGTIESSPAETRKRCTAAASSCMRYAVRAERLARELLQRRERAVVALAREVELGAVAGREADRVAEAARQLGRAVERQRDALAQLDRRDVVRDADERQLQKCVPASTMRTTITTAKPASAR